MDLLGKTGEVSANKLADSLGVSVWTIRRDLSVLEERGVLLRRYGGASLVEANDAVCHLDEPNSVQAPTAENQDAKRRIGITAARLLHPRERVALAGGSTTLEVAKGLKNHHFKGEIITNALDIALELSEEQDIHVVCTGGDVQPRYRTLVGAVSERMLKLQYFDVAVIGVSGVSVRHGITVNSQVNATALELMVDHSCRTILVIDSTKLGRVSFASLTLTAPIDFLVTDEPLPYEYNRYFQAMKTRVLIAEKRL